MQARTKQTSKKEAAATLSKFITMHQHAQAKFCLGTLGKQRLGVLDDEFSVISGLLLEVRVP